VRCTVRAPFSTALPRRLVDITDENISGNSVSTSKIIAGARSLGALEIEQALGRIVDDALCAGVDALHERVDERQEQLAAAGGAHLEHLVRARVEAAGDLAERRAR